MKWMKQQSKYENMAYVALWGLLFAAPLLSLYIRAMHDTDMVFDWHEVWVVWRLFGIYLVLFLVHNFLLAPLLVHGRKRWLYILLTACMLGAFTVYQCNSRPGDMRHGPDDMRHGPREMVHHERMHPEPPEFEEGFGHHGPPPEHKHTPPAFIGEHDIIAIVILILMLGMNLGIKFYFKNRGDQKKLIALEKENLEQQLEYLKYQINPHFFMNTLNNIHALVDIDPEKAKGTILELSKMMRFVLYEGNKQGVPLSREFDFIRNYITLMRLRYTDKVRIDVDLPNEAPDCKIPPLMLITFIENAFKHGISYQKDSFIDIHIAVGNELTFTCRNSKADKAATKREQSDARIDSAEREQARPEVKPNEEKGGVGLKNVKQRLNLLYDNNYTLNIKDETDVYYVELTIPLT